MLYFIIQEPPLEDESVTSSSSSLLEKATLEGQSVTSEEPLASKETEFISNLSPKEIIHDNTTQSNTMEEATEETVPEESVNAKTLVVPEEESEVELLLIYKLAD